MPFDICNLTIGIGQMPLVQFATFKIAIGTFATQDRFQQYQLPQVTLPPEL